MAELSGEAYDKAARAEADERNAQADGDWPRCEVPDCGCSGYAHE